MAVLSLFDKSGIMVLPWARAGYECFCVDIAHKEGHSVGNVSFIKADLWNWRPPINLDFQIIFASPPCTDLSISGNRWRKRKGLKRIAESLLLFGTIMEFCEESGRPYAIENPVGIVSSVGFKPDYIFNPCEYGFFCKEDNYTKRTCIWCGNGFKIPQKYPIQASDGSRMHSKVRDPELRSLTPKGFAKAVFEANKNFVKKIPAGV